MSTRTIVPYNSSSPSSSSFLPSPPPTIPPHRPAFSAASTVPFSWEEHPGVPKPRLGSSDPPAPALPLPPAFQSNPNSRKKRAPPTLVSDPFAAALAECSKPVQYPKHRPFEPAAALIRKSPKEHRFGLGFSVARALKPLDLSASCRSSDAVVDPAAYVRQPAQQTIAYSLLHKRH